jgi:YegS/Rv2252/BmrU family lipid kinase
VLAELLRAASFDFEEVLTTRPREATDIARKAVRQSRPLIMVLGGDGTLNEVVNGFFDGGAPIPTSSVIGFLPSGTGGDTRRTLGIPVNPEAAIRVLIDGLPRPIDAGRVTMGTNVHYFVNIAEAGIGADVSERINRMPKALGSASYFVATIASIVIWKHKRLRVKVDGQVAREVIGQGVVVANCQFYGGGMWVAPQAIPDDGVFDVIIAGAIGKLEAVLKAPKLYAGTHFQDIGLRSKLELIHGTTVEVSSVDRVLVELDGEVIGQLPATFQVVPHALRIMVPKS